ncbi:hypothetical protein Bca101_020644 [Brassica carinata]
MDEERGKSVDSWDKPSLAEIKNSLDSPHSFLKEQNRSDIFQIDNDVLSDMEDQIEFIGRTDQSDPHPVLNTDSFTRDYDIAVKSRTEREKFNIKQVFTGNRKKKADFYGKTNIVYGKLMEKTESLSEHIRRLESQVAEIAIAIKREAGRLPGRTDSNPRRQVSVVMLQSGKRLARSTKNFYCTKN